MTSAPPLRPPYEGAPTPLTPTARQGNIAFAVAIGLLLVRLVLGWTFIFHGSQKVFGAFGGTGLEKFTEAISQMPLPAFLPSATWAQLAAYGELVGGCLVLVGFLARLGTIPIITSMVVAIVYVHGKNGFGMDKMGFEYNLNLLAECAAILIIGPGLISIDALIFRRAFWARGPQPLSDPTTRRA